MVSFISVSDTGSVPPRFERDKLAHLAAGFGLMAAALFLTDVTPWAWIAVAGSLAAPFAWELVTRRRLDLEGARDVIATFVGFGLAGLTWLLLP